jgi:hypothetical protein
MCSRSRDGRDAAPHLACVGIREKNVREKKEDLE